MRPQRSLRLEKRSAKSLDTLSGASGEIFYDVDSGTLRIYTNNAGEKVIMATRSWTLDQISDSSFSGNYGDLNGVPTFLSAFTNNVGYITLDDIPEAEIPISTLTGLADVTIDTPVIGQLLEYDGTSWVNTTVAGFTDTNTTYNLNLVTNVDGVDLNLTNSDLVSDTVTILGGGGIAVTISDTNEITIDNDAQYTLDDITGLTISNPQNGDVLEYNGGLWLNVPGTPGVTLTSFTVTSQPASGSGSLTYDDTSGQFTYTPPDLGVAGVALSDLSVTTSTSTEGGTLTYNDSNGVFTFQPAEVNTLTPNTIQFPTGVSISEFSDDTTLTDSSTSAVPTENAVKTYVDTAISGVSGGDSFDQTLNTTDDVQFNSVTSNTFSSGAAGAPVITSASTITLDAPDGTIVQNGPFRLPSLTTTEKNALTAVNGDMVYDSTLNKAQVRENGAWVNLV